MSKPDTPPRVFPGINGCEAEGIPSFVCLDDLPVEWHHLVPASREMVQVIHAATHLPVAETEEARLNLLALMDMAEQSFENKLTTLRAIREWSLANLGKLSPKASSTKHEPKHEAAPTTHATKSHG